MTKRIKRAIPLGHWRTATLAAVAMLAVVAFSFRAQGQEKKAPQAPPRSPGSPRESWSELRAEAKAYPAKQWAATKKAIRSLRIVRRPHAVLQGYDAEPELWKSMTSFYDLIKGRELDMYAEQPGIPEFFPSREAYYDFLDTILPAMRDRQFERNRLLSYRVHEIKSVGQEADVIISIKSDDSLRIGKSMVFHQRWLSQGYRWYPGKVTADAATIWERIK